MRKLVSVYFWVKVKPPASPESAQNRKKLHSRRKCRGGKSFAARNIAKFVFVKRKSFFSVIKAPKMETKTPKSTSSDSGSVFFNQRSFGSDSGATKQSKRNISKSKLREYRDAFSLFDKDGNGYLTKEELGHVMHQLGQWARMEELQEMLAEIDTDGDGNVSFEEFVEILLNITDSDQDSSAAQEEQELRDAFKVFDKHNRGYITASDLRAVLQCLGEDLDSDESKTNKFISAEDSHLKPEIIFFLSSSRGHDQRS